MKTVIAKLNPPKENEVKRGTTAPKTGIEYSPSFFLESVNKKKPIHIGGTLEILVKDENGKTEVIDSCHLIIEDKGKGELEYSLRRTKAVKCSAE